ncbi:MAG: hypothetical protein R2879_13865 [Saprospiraceae bacterium]
MKSSFLLLTLIFVIAISCKKEEPPIEEEKFRSLPNLPVGFNVDINKDGTDDLLFRFAITWSGPDSIPTKYFAYVRSAYDRKHLFLRKGYETIFMDDLSQIKPVPDTPYYWHGKERNSVADLGRLQSIDGGENWPLEWTLYAPEVKDSYYIGVYLHDFQDRPDSLGYVKISVDLENFKITELETGML